MSSAPPWDLNVNVGLVDNICQQSANNAMSSYGWPKNQKDMWKNLSHVLGTPCQHSHHTTSHHNTAQAREANMPTSLVSHLPPLLPPPTLAALCNEIQPRPQIVPPALVTVFVCVYACVHG